MLGNARLHQGPVSTVIRSVIRVAYQILSYFSNMLVKETPLTTIHSVELSILVLGLALVHSKLNEDRFSLDRKVFDFAHKRIEHIGAKYDVFSRDLVEVP